MREEGRAAGKTRGRGGDKRRNLGIGAFSLNTVALTSKYSGNKIKFNGSVFCCSTLVPSGAAEEPRASHMGADGVHDARVRCRVR